MLSPSEDEEVISELDEEKKFEMTREEVEYFMKSIEQEWLNRDTYYLSTGLIKRMRAFLENN